MSYSRTHTYLISLNLPTTILTRGQNSSQNLQPDLLKDKLNITVVLKFFGP